MKKANRSPPHIVYEPVSLPHQPEDEGENEDYVHTLSFSNAEGAVLESSSQLEVLGAGQGSGSLSPTLTSP